MFSMSILIKNKNRKIEKSNPICFIFVSIKICNRKIALKHVIQRTQKKQDIFD